VSEPPSVRANDAGTPPHAAGDLQRARGRGEGVVDEQRAVEVDPLAPALGRARHAHRGAAQGVVVEVPELQGLHALEHPVATAREGLERGVEEVHHGL
jgi:hypothetical protein